MIQGAETRLDGTTLVVRIPMRLQRRGGRKRIVAPDGSHIAPTSKPQPDGALVKALVRAWRWQRMLDDGDYGTVSEIGDAENISKSYVSRILRLALLAPDIVEGILAATADQASVLERLKRPLPASWVEQRARILEPKTSLAVLVEGVATDTAQPKTMVEAMVRAALARIEGAVGKRETVNLVGFGRFEVYERGARRGRNLRTGEILKIPAIRAVRFRIGKRLRDAAAGSKSKRSGKGKK